MFRVQAGHKHGYGAGSEGSSGLLGHGGVFGEGDIIISSRLDDVIVPNCGRKDSSDIDGTLDDVIVREGVIFARESPDLHRKAVGIRSLDSTVP